MEAMRNNGMGGATIVPIYGVKGYEDQYIEHLSPKFIDMMSHAAQEAKRLGMWVDMTPGTGWPFGGPFVTEEWCDTRAKLEKNNQLILFPGRKVKRAAPGGAGLCIDPYSPEAMSRYLSYYDKAFDRDDITLPRAFYHDSFEFQGNWSRALPEEFKKRRGYDLMKHLPVLFGKNNDLELEIMARIKSDYRETLADLHLEYIEVLAAWAESKGRTTRNQAHGSPANLLDVYAASGIPETETFGATPFKIPGIRREAHNVRKDYPQPLINRIASSAAHVAGKPLVASESCTWIRNHFRAALSQAKPEIDQLLLNGINHIFIHGTCYSPKEAPWPGWLFYASFEYNPRNAIWRDAKYLNAYITRCQSILQSGAPDNDVALYWPIYDIWHDSDPKKMQQMLTVHHTEWLTDSSCGKTAEWLKDNGYGFDYISDRQLRADLSKPYQAVVVPKTEHMPLATLKKLFALADGGQPVIFLDQLPTDVPGLHKFANRRSELKQLLKGRQKMVVNTGDLKQSLANTAVAREPMSARTGTSLIGIGTARQMPGTFVSK